MIDRIAVTLAEIEIMQHTLGLPNKRHESYRNYFNAEEGHGDMPTLISLCDKGLMEKYRPNYFHVTENGKAFMQKVCKFKEAR